MKCRSKKKRSCGSTLFGESRLQCKKREEHDKQLRTELGSVRERCFLCIESSREVGGIVKGHRDWIRVFCRRRDRRREKPRPLPLHSDSLSPSFLPLSFLGRFRHPRTLCRSTAATISPFRLGTALASLLSRALWRLSQQVDQVFQSILLCIPSL